MGEPRRGPGPFLSAAIGNVPADLQQSLIRVPSIDDFHLDFLKLKSTSDFVLYSTYVGGSGVPVNAEFLGQVPARQGWTILETSYTVQVTGVTSQYEVLSTCYRYEYYSYSCGGGFGGSRTCTSYYTVPYACTEQRHDIAVRDNTNQTNYTQWTPETGYTGRLIGNTSIGWSNNQATRAFTGYDLVTKSTKSNWAWVTLEVRTIYQQPDPVATQTYGYPVTKYDHVPVARRSILVKVN